MPSRPSHFLSRLSATFRTLFRGAVLLMGSGQARAQVSYYSADFGSAPSSAAFYGNASRTGGVAQLVPASTGQLGSLVVGNISGASAVTIFDVSCDVYTGNAANASLPADGWCFAWGTVPAAAFSEEGPAGFTGLVVSFDYYVNAPETFREVTVSWNGVQIGRVPYDAYTTGTTVPVHIRLRNGGLLDVRHNGNELFSGLALPGFGGLTGPAWGFGARTGGQTARVTLDNLVITPNPIVVTNTAASGTGSLARAVSDAETVYPGGNQIHFDGALNGQVITLTGTPLSLNAQTVTLDASTLSSGVTISANNLSRVLNVPAGCDALLNRITIQDGRTDAATYSPGIALNGTLAMLDCTLRYCLSDAGGTLSVLGAKLKARRCTFHTNLVAKGGSAVWIQGAAASALFQQCTFHGNYSADVPGAIVALDGSSTFDHCTIGRNTSGDACGGLYLQSPATVTLRNSIIGANTGGTQPDILLNNGTLLTQGGNVLGKATGSVVNTWPFGQPNANGDHVDTDIDTKLSDIGFYGGYTQTVKLLEGSPARDASVGSTVAADQRLLSVVGTADSGTTEYRVGLIADQSMMEDQTLTLTVAAGTETNLTATCSNTALLPVSGIALTGSGTARTLKLTPTPNAYGTAVVTVADIISGDMESFTLTVLSVNDMPSFTLGRDVIVSAGTTSQQVYGNWASDFRTGPADESAQTLEVLITAVDPGLFSSQPALSLDGTLNFSPAPGASGSTHVNITLRDNGGTANGGTDTGLTQTFAITIADEAPRFYSTFGAGVPAGSSYFGHALPQAPGARLVSSAGGELGSYVVQNITGSVPVTVFDVQCDVFTGEPGNHNLPADGWCVAVGDVPLTAFGEEGPASFTGLAVSFDYYINAPDTSREVTVKWNGTQIASVPYDAYVHNQTVPVHIRLRHGGLLDVWHNGNRLFTGLPLPGFSSFGAPRWGFGARTGGLTAKVVIQSLVINPQPFAVTSTAASGTGSLQAQLDKAADETGTGYIGPNQIHFATSLNGQTLAVPADGVYIDNHTVAIDASTLSSGVTLTANNAGPLMETNNNSVNAFLNRLTLTSGRITDGSCGAGIQLSGILEMKDCTITQCVSTADGGAVECQDECFFTATNCTFSNNEGRLGGAIHLAEGAATLDNCSFSQNKASSAGGAIDLAGGSLTARGCTFESNEANSGGAVWCSPGNAQLRLERCTLSGNRAVLGGGGALALLSGSHAVQHCTITGNRALTTGGGILLTVSASLQVENSIIAENTADNTGGADDPGHDLLKFLQTTLTRSGANFIGMAEGQAAAIFPAGTPNANGDCVGDIGSPASPQLGALGNYGGPTRTCPLRTGSQARNAAAGSTSTADQRGYGMIGVPDIGAYEAGHDTAFSVWAVENSGSATALQANGDEDADGQTNLAEYAFRTDPLGAGSFGTLTMGADGSISFPVHRPGGIRLAYTLRKSSDLSVWSLVGDFQITASTTGLLTLTGVTGGFDETAGTYTFSFSPAASAADRRFWRVEVRQF